MDDAASIGNWIQAGGTVLGFFLIWRKVCGLKERRDIYPQPLQVKPADDPVSKTDCIAVHRKLDDTLRDIDARHSTRTEGLRREIKGDMNGISDGQAKRSEALRVEIKSDVSGVHRRIDAVLAAVSTLDGQIRELGKSWGSNRAN